MTRPRLLCTVIASVWLTGLASPGHAEDWIEARSSHFTVLSNAGKGRASQALDDLEDLRRLITEMLPSQPVESDTPVAVVLFDGEKSMRDFQPARDGRPEEWAALFRSTTFKKYLFIQSQRDRDNTRELVYGQFLSLIQSYNSVNVPLWFSNGLSLFYANAEILDDSANVGRAHQRHRRVLGEFKYLPISALFDVEYGSPRYRDPNHRPLFDAQCWVFVHYLLLGQGPEGVGITSRFLELLSRGTEGRTALAQASGRSLESLDEGAFTYIRKSISRYVRIGLTRANESDDDYLVRPLGESETMALRGELLLAAGKVEAARATLEAAVEDDPDLVGTYESLGLLHLTQNDTATAAGFLLKASERGSKNYAVYEKLALIQLGDYLQGTQASIPPDILQPAIRSLRTAHQLAPASAETARALGFVSLFDGGNASEGIATITRTLEHHPGDARLLFVLAQLYNAKSAHAPALTILESLGQRSIPTDLTGPVEQLRKITEQRMVNAGSDRMNAPPATETPDSRTSLSGTLLRLDCERDGASFFIVESSGQLYALRVRDPARVTILEGGQPVIDKQFVCGPQDGAAVTAVWAPLDEDDGTGEQLGELHSLELK